MATEACGLYAHLFERVPKHWRLQCLSDAVDFQEGPGILAVDFRDAGVPLLRLSSITAGKTTFVGCNFLDPERVEKKWSHFKLVTGDILLSTSGSLGRVSEVAEPQEGSICYTGIIRFRPKIEALRHSFIKYFLQSSFFEKQANASAAGSVLKHFGPSHLKQMTFPVPSEAEQVGMEKLLAPIDEKIDLNRRVNVALEAVAQAIFQSWLVDFDPVKAKIAAKAEGRDPLRAAMNAISGEADAELDALPPEQYEQLAATAALFPDEMEASELGEIPKGWSHKPLLHLTDKIGSGSTPRGGKEVYLEEGVALIRSQNVYDSLFAWDGLARISDEAAAQLKGVTVQEEDVLLNITGASILRTCVVEPDVLPARVNQHVAIIRAKVGVPPRFIHMHLLRTDIKNYLLGLNAGASREAITKAHIESLVLLTPGPELLSAFQTAISPLFQQVHCLTRQMRALGELRDTLLPKLLSGELAVESLVENFEAA